MLFHVKQNEMEISEIAFMSKNLDKVRFFGFHDGDRRGKRAKRQTTGPFMKGKFFVCIVMAMTVFPVFLLFLADTAVSAGKETVLTLPLDDKGRETAVRELLKDKRFSAMFLSGLIAKEGAAAQPESGETPARTAGMNDTPSHGMIAGPSSGMSAESGPDADLSAADGIIVPPVQPEGLLREGRLPKKSEIMRRTVLPAPVKADSVDLFMSLSCPHCRTLWKGLRADPASREHLLEDRTEIRIIPQSDADGAVAMIYEWIMAQDPEKGMEFLDLYFDRDFGSDITRELLSNANDWIVSQGLKSILDLRDVTQRNVADAIADKLRKGSDLAQSYGMTGYPSIYVDGKEDRLWFKKLPR